MKYISVLVLARAVTHIRPFKVKKKWKLNSDAIGAGERVSRIVIQPGFEID
jgi:hypothetical protein